MLLSTLDIYPGCHDCDEYDFVVHKYNYFFYSKLFHSNAITNKNTKVKNSTVILKK